MSTRSPLRVVLVALALLARLLAPMAADARAFDPLLDAPICTHDGSAPAPSGGGRTDPAHIHALCDLTCCQPLPFAPDPQGVTTIVRPASVVALPHTTETPRVGRTLHAHRARGPPRFA